MVAAFLLLHPSRGGPGGDVDLEANLGVLLMDFLRLYGRSLNTSDVGVSCRQAPFPRLASSIVMYILMCSWSLLCATVGTARWQLCRCERRKGGCYFAKRSRGMLQPERPYMLAVEDPKDPSNDLGKGSYNIQKVGQAAHTHHGKQHHSLVSRTGAGLLYNQSPKDMICRMFWVVLSQGQLKIALIMRTGEECI